MVGLYSRRRGGEISRSRAVTFGRSPGLDLRATLRVRATLRGAAAPLRVAPTGAAPHSPYAVFRDAAGRGWDP